MSNGHIAAGQFRVGSGRPENAMRTPERPSCESLNPEHYTLQAMWLLFDESVVHQ